MHHLFLTRKAAASITCAMRYFMAKKRSKITQAQSQYRRGAEGSLISPRLPLRTSNHNFAINPTSDLEEELMISERVEAEDLKEYHSMMSNRLQEFREEWNELKHLRLSAENETE